jgi:Holliday junction resolvase-like predicted endonuclease
MQTNAISVDILLQNKRKGNLGEKIARNDYENNGYSVISTRFGSDFLVYKKIGTKLYQEYVEVKTGRARQSATQRKKMRIIKRMGLNYTLYRITEQFLIHYSDTLAENCLNDCSKKEKLYSLAGDS